VLSKLYYGPVVDEAGPAAPPLLAFGFAAGRSFLSERGCPARKFPSRGAMRVAAPIEQGATRTFTKVAVVGVPWTPSPPWTRASESATC
jgi:hypothetical protein